MAKLPLNITIFVKCNFFRFFLNHPGFSNTTLLLKITVVIRTTAIFSIFFRQDFPVSTKSFHKKTLNTAFSAT